jgi:hypothetical protein
VEVLDLSGRRVRRLARGPLAAGRHTLHRDDTDERGRPAQAGVYLVRAIGDDYDRDRSIVILHQLSRVSLRSGLIDGFGRPGGGRTRQSSSTITLLRAKPEPRSLTRTK